MRFSDNAPIGQIPVVIDGVNYFSYVDQGGQYWATGAGVRLDASRIAEADRAALVQSNVDPGFVYYTPPIIAFPPYTQPVPFPLPGVVPVSPDQVNTVPGPAVHPDTTKTVITEASPPVTPVAVAPNSHSPLFAIGAGLLALYLLGR